MADDFDVEAMLEAPFRKDENKSYHANGHDEHSKKKKRSRSRSRSPGSKKKKSRSRSRDGKKSKKRSRSRDKKRSRSKERHRSGSRSRDRAGRYKARKSPIRKRSRSRSPFKKEKSPVRQPIDNLTPEERDARTVFCMQLAARIRARDLEDFFSAVGKVRDVRIISDRNSRRSKGIAYIEFVESSSVPLAIGLTGQRLLGVPIIVQASQLNGFELAGRPMKVGHVTERSDSSTASSFLDNDELERTGIDLGTTGRLQLMARLAEGWFQMQSTGFCLIFINNYNYIHCCENFPVLHRNWPENPSCCSAGSSDDWIHTFWGNTFSSR
ncbi:hypothetical protein GOODEAATRI_003092 [Goodea atripinnis]|uniref:RRM domain-containing protein n=1 Tax=Goodea atripinnis TaxID=208336 RepID=A0ABV0MHH5_9TELE